MSEHALLDSTTRVALAAYLHDLGKFAERAGAFSGDPRLDAHLQLYCPFHREGGWFSHRHAAHTALALDLIERHLPFDMSGEMAPFSARKRAGDEAADEATDSLINAAAGHHKPGTFLQWIVATADRIASGFEREEFEKYNAAADRTAGGRNHYQARQLTLFEQISLDSRAVDDTKLSWRYPLEPLSPVSIFPRLARDCEPVTDEPAKKQYHALWEGFVAALDAMPRSHRAAPDLWFDHFDSLWMTWTHAIPAATAFNIKPEVSLYDHSRAAAAIAAALWRWHLDAGRTGADAAREMASRADYGVPKMLLVQGDFFGIQDFIFASGAQTQRHAARLLRGRSFQVSLFSELAALRILDALSLPPTSLVSNAAGRFLVVAPNTKEVAQALERLRAEFDEWFLEHTFGMAGVGLAWSEASCADFLRGRDGDSPFANLMTRLHQTLEVARLQRFGLASGAGGVLEASYPHGPCAWNGQLPADRPGDDREPPSCALSRDQIAIGGRLVGAFERLLVLDSTAPRETWAGGGLSALETDILGYRLAFTRAEEASGKFGTLAQARSLKRCWDFSLPDPEVHAEGAVRWNGYARRSISGYVPRVRDEDLKMPERYRGVEADLGGVGQIETFDMIACEDRELLEHGWQGIEALAVLKGDIDDLGELFRVGLQRPSFAKHAGLSRQVNAFFVTYLPDLLSREFPKVYTVFAGGDDFFLIGPWRTVQQVAVRLRSEFSRYVAGNPAIHFSVGIAIQKSGAPVRSLADLADQALSLSKAHDGKDAVTCFGETVPWKNWAALEAAVSSLEALRDEFQLSTAYVYGLLQFVELRSREAADPSAAIWRSRMAYRTRRMVVDRVRDGDASARERRFVRIAQDVGQRGIEALGPAYRIVLFNHLYRHRNPQRSEKTS